jgi:hypothetical protein
MPAPTRNIEVAAVVASPDTVTSPLGGARGAVVRVEVLQDRGPPAPYVLLGAVTLGDVLALETAGGERFQIVIRRATLVLAVAEAPLVPLALHVPAELVPLLGAASGVGALYAREHVLRCGDAVRLQASVEPDGTLRADLAHVVRQAERPVP